MKRSKKLLAFLVISFVTLAAAYAFGVSALRAQIESTLSQACRRPVTVRSVQVALPLGIRLVGLNVPPLGAEPGPPLSMEELQVQVSLGPSFQGRPALALEFVRPQFSIPWNRQVQEVLRAGGLPGGSQLAAPIASVRIREGKIRVVDEQVVPPVSWNLHRVNATAEGLSGGNCAFRVSAGLQGKGEVELGSVDAEGSFLRAGPVEAKVRLGHRGLGLLAPYLREVLGVTPDQGSLQLSSQLTVHEGVLMSHHEAAATGVRFPTDQPTTLGVGGNRLVELLADREGKIHLSFMVNGRLDGQLDWSDLAAAAMREALRQAMARSIQRTLDDTQPLPLEERLRKQMESIGR